MYVNQFFPLFRLSSVLPFSLIKSVFAVSLERASTLDVLFSSPAQHISMQQIIQRLALLQKELMKKVDKFLK